MVFHIPTYMNHTSERIKTEEQWYCLAPIQMFHVMWVKNLRHSEIKFNNEDSNLFLVIYLNCLR